MTTGDQTRVFLAMLICGAGTGVAHDLLAIFRRGVILTALADFLLGILLAAGVIGASLLLECDLFRLYVLCGILAGWMLYLLFLGTIVRILTRTFAELSKKVAN